MFRRLQLYFGAKTEKYVHYLNITVQLMICLSLATYCLETVPELSEYDNVFHMFEIFFGATFGVEYLLRVIIAERRLKFIFSFYGIVDFIAIVPTILTFGVIDLKVLRALRLLRLFRILKLVRYSNAIDRLLHAFHSVKNEFIVFGLFTVILIFLSSIGIYHFEHEAQPDTFKSVFHAMWWAVVSLTTVGYGDIAPITVGGKIFTSIILFLGLGIVAVPTGLIASALSQKKKCDRRR